MGERVELVERLKALSGPDREVDADIYIAFFIPHERVGRIDRLGGCVGWWPKDAPYESAIDVPPYTASLDAAVALVERKMPKSYRASGKTGLYPGMLPGSPVERFWAECGDWGAPCRAYHDHEAIALLIALLTAMEPDHA